MATRYASNGTLRASAHGGGPGRVIAQCTDITVNSNSNREYVVTTSGDSGPTDGIATAKVTGKCAVKKASAERKQLLRAKQNNEVITFAYRSGDMDFLVEGVIDSITLTSSVNKKDEFDFEVMGTEQPIQDV